MSTGTTDTEFLREETMRYDESQAA